MQKYVCGFLFDQQKNVVLIRKNKPEWQNGFLNGVGGKVEEGESNLDAMIREFNEEVGVYVPYWRPFCEIQGIDWIVYFYHSICGHEMVNDIKSFNENRKNGEENIEIIPIDEVNDNRVVINLKWLIPMCFDNHHKYAKIESY
jgi:8-oxo-dGTP diphosphatase